LTFEKIVEALRRRGFKSSVRLAIMIYLLAKRSAYFSDIAEDLDMTPGNLWSHIEKLEEDGLVEVKHVIDGRPRTVVAITEKGIEETIELLRMLLEAAREILKES